MRSAIALAFDTPLPSHLAFVESPGELGAETSSRVLPLLPR